MNIFRFVIFISSTFFIYSCGSPDKEINKPVASLDAKSKVSGGFMEDTIFVTDNEVKFTNDSIPLIMEQVGLCVCDTNKVNEAKGIFPCMEYMFRYFANSRQPIRDGFLVEIKPGIFGETFLLVNIALNDSTGKYQVTNQYIGQLLEIHTKEKGKHHIVVRYPAADNNTITFMHKWNGEKYEPVEVVAMNDYNIEKAKIDSVSAVYIKDFVWGY